MGTLVVAAIHVAVTAIALLLVPQATLAESGAPFVAVLDRLTGAGTVVLMNYSKTLVEGFTFLSVLVTAAGMPLWASCSLALAVLSMRERTSLPRYARWAGLGGCVFAIYILMGVGAEPFLWALVLIAAGAPFYLWQGRRARTSARVPAST